MPVEKLDFEARLIVGGEPVTGELLAVADLFEENIGMKMDNAERMVNKDAVVGTFVVVEREMVLTFRGVTPSQRNAEN